MRACLMSISVLMIVAVPAAAQPQKTPPAPATATQQPPVVLASADGVRPSPQNNRQTEPASAAVKRIKPHVTTCRCGDPLPDVSEQQ